MDSNLRLISSELVKIYNIDGLYGKERGCLETTPSKEKNVTSSVVLWGYFY
ncbi:hypothetical protein [Chryseobacterium gleum]|uniref:hypothetical protein n=1 Tax=Chryseobacterium gleum TaxID=250 RepID=UPI0013F15906|nr:hypothetical protein [Chryseobacterium gleum]